MKYPNLFILGAPKCGTTALADWIATHPQIYVSPTKEPHYFSEEYQLTPSIADYLAHFKNATTQQIWKCEASVWQLFSPNAVPNILKVIASPRFVVMLRNPMEMAPSMHSQQVYNGNELISDFSDAVKLSKERSIGSSEGVLNGYPPNHLAYLHSCALGWQLERLFSLVKPETVHVIFMEDIKHDPKAVLEKLYFFLGLHYAGPEEFTVINSAKIRIFPVLDKAVKAIGDWKSQQGIGIRFGLLSTMRRLNKRERKVPEVPNSIKLFMQQAFRNDVALLETLTRRNLSHWLKL